MPFQERKKKFTFTFIPTVIPPSKKPVCQAVSKKKEETVNAVPRKTNKINLYSPT